MKQLWDKRKNFILGLGISGAIASQLLPDWNVITTSMTEVTRPLGPYYVYYDETVSKIVEALVEHPCGVKKIRPGYYTERRELVPPDSGVVCAYYSWSRDGVGSPTEKWINEHLKREHIVLDVSFSEIGKYALSKLYGEDRMIESNVEKIDTVDKKITIEGGVEFSYDNIISTIPAPIMDNVCRIKSDVGYEWRSLCMDIEKCDQVGLRFLYGSPFDYVYMLAGRANRVTKLESPWVVTEYADISHQALRLQRVKFGKIISGRPSEKLMLGNIFPLGRLAQWNNTFKTSDIVKRVEEITQNLG